MASVTLSSAQRCGSPMDLTREPLADVDGRPVYLRDISPSMREIDELLDSAFDPLEYRRVYAGFAERNPRWNQIPAATGHLYQWDRKSLYIREPPYFDASMAGASSVEVSGARAASGRRQRADPRPRRHRTIRPSG
jgi:aconitate hydratase